MWPKSCLLITGVLKQVKDCIKECSHCQSKQEKGRGSAEDATKQTVRQVRRKTSAYASEEEDDEANDDLDEEQSSAVDKHELVFVSTECCLCQ